MILLRHHGTYIQQAEFFTSKSQSVFCKGKFSLFDNYYPKVIVIIIVFKHLKILIFHSFQSFGTPNNINFPFGTNGKLTVLGVQILKHFRVTFALL